MILVPLPPVATPRATGGMESGTELAQNFLNAGRKNRRSKSAYIAAKTFLGTIGKNICMAYHAIANVLAWATKIVRRQT